MLGQSPDIVRGRLMVEYIKCIGQLHIPQTQRHVLLPESQRSAHHRAEDSPVHLERQRPLSSRLLGR